jgi:cytochrome bd ubiquinol oxidase subunit I
VNATTLARWQFATTTVYHFLIVPLTIGLTVLVATMQTLAYLKRDQPSGETWDRAARFWGRIMLVIFALGVVTGIVQEFQFGMNWSRYSRFVGDIFGAPLAMEGLVAFFLESTFLGLWIFGRGLLSAKVHCAMIWLAAIGTVISAYFILAANSFMQHPVGLRYNEDKHRVELTSIWKVMTNSTQLATFPHTIFGALMTAGAILVSVSAWHIRRERTSASAESTDAPDPLHRKVAALGLGVVLVSTIGVSVVGHVQGQIMTRQQPMKMAAAEALWDTKDHAGFSLFAYGDVSKGRNKIDITIPDGLSILATNSRGGTVQGINDVQAAESAKYGPGDYTPIVGLAYWTFRLMIGFGVLAALLAAAIALQWRRGRLNQSTLLLRAGTWMVVLPLLANTAGWLFTETARQPWLVYGLLKTQDGISPNVSLGFVAATLIGFTALYGVLGVICFRMTRRIAQAGPDKPPAEVAETAPDPDALSLV